MKNKPSGTDSNFGYMNRVSCLEKGCDARRRRARQQYLKDRYNSSRRMKDVIDKSIEDSFHYSDLSSPTSVDQSSFGRYEWIPAPDKGEYYYRMQYTESPVVKAWMEEQDRIYLNELFTKPKHYALFLKELTPRNRLLEADQKACLGLVMSDPHHQNLTREYAVKKAEIESRLSSTTVAARPTTLPSIPSGASKVHAIDLSITASVAPVLAPAPAPRSVETVFTLGEYHLKSGTIGRTAIPSRISHFKMFFNQMSLKKAEKNKSTIFFYYGSGFEFTKVMGDGYIEAVQNYAAGRFNTTGSVADLMRKFPCDGISVWVEVGDRDWKGASYIIEYREGVRDKVFLEAQDLKYLWELILIAPDPQQALQKIRTSLDLNRNLQHYQNLQRELTTKALEALSYHKSLHPELTVEALQAKCKEEAEMAKWRAQAEAYKLREKDRAQEQLRREEAAERTALAKEQRRREEAAKAPQIGVVSVSNGRSEELGHWKNGKKHGVCISRDKSNRSGHFTLSLYHEGTAQEHFYFQPRATIGYSSSSESWYPQVCSGIAALPLDDYKASADYFSRAASSLAQTEREINRNVDIAVERNAQEDKRRSDEEYRKAREIEEAERYRREERERRISEFKNRASTRFYQSKGDYQEARESAYKQGW